MVETIPREMVPMSERTEAPYILIVDDDSGTAQHLQHYLERQGYRASTVFSGEKALHQIETQRPDLLILDLTLPDLGGWEICQTIKERSDYGYLPIIILTDVQEQRQRLAGMLSGADDYMAKPIVDKDLLIRVQALLRTKTQIDHLIRENQHLTNNLQERNAELEAALLLASQTETLKSHIIESVSHELRTPLLQVKSSVAMLSDVIKEISTVERDHNIGRMATQAVARLEDLITNITQLHLIENLNLSPILLKDAVTQSLTLMRRSWSYQDQLDRVQQRIENVPPVLGHYRAVSRLLYILLENALKFSKEKIEIHIHQMDDKEVKIAVKDYGIGIAPEYHQQIFDTFFQIDKGSTRQFGGVGIGLSSAQMLARGLNTAVHVESEPTQGSTFWFILPIADLDAD